jgi:hypothetical protein
VKGAALVSDSLIPISDEQAKLGQEIVKALSGLGSFFEKALGSTPQDLVAYLGGDWLRIRRRENIARMLYEARARLVDMGKIETQPAPLSLALPILQGAADEDREELVDLWARLFASAMDPATRNNVRRAFIAAVKEMDPSDARVLQYIYSHEVTCIRKVGGDNIRDVNMEFISERLGNRRDDVAVSVAHLLKLGFLVTTLDRVEDIWYTSAELKEFMLACYPELGTPDNP